MSAQKGTIIFKKWWFWVVVAVAVCIIIGLASNSGKSNDVNGNSTSTKEAASTTAAPTKAAAFDWATADVNEANIKLAVKGVHVTGFIYEDTSIVHVDVAAGSADNLKKVTLVVYPGVPLNEDGFVRVMMTMAVKYSEELFKNPAIESVSVHNIIRQKDDYGKTSDDDASYVNFTRDTIQKIDVDGFLDNVYGNYSKCYSIADFYWITGSVYFKLQDVRGMPEGK